MIRRRTAWKTPAELEAAGKRSTEVAESDFPDSIRWIRTYVVEEDGGELGSVCIYEAADAVPSANTPRGLHARRRGAGDRRHRNRTPRSGEGRRLNPVSSTRAL